jgi:hydrogenase nickel incorporation protein HypA/HybF
MHELALAEEIVAASLQAFATHGGRRLDRVHVVVGEHNHVDPLILRDAFTIAATGTEAATAVLDVERPPDLCAACAAQSTISGSGAAVTAIDIAEELPPHPSGQGNVA